MTDEEKVKLINKFRDLIHLIIKTCGKPGRRNRNVTITEVYLGKAYFGRGVIITGETRWVSSVNGEDVFFESTWPAPRANELSFAYTEALRELIPKLLVATLLDQLADV